MSRVHIIADASWDKDTKLGGYAGGVAKFNDDGNEVTKHYAGHRAEMYDANSGEGLAVIAGLRTLLKMQKLATEPLESVIFYSDSATIIRQYDGTINGKPGNPKYAPIIEEIISLTKKLGDSTTFSFEKVKAHVNDLKATPIERLHNLIDLEAKRARLSLYNHIVSPDVEHSNYYACVLPATPNSEEYAALSALGYGMATKGMLARVRFNGDMKINTPDHPFIAGIERAANEKGVSSQSLVNIIRRGESTDVLNGTAFLDRTIIRMQRKKNFIDHKDSGGFDNYSVSQGGVANRLMYGLQSPQRLNLSHPTGRIEPASKFVIDLSHGELKRAPSTVGDWLKSFSAINKMLVINSLSRALMLNEIPEPQTLTRSQVKPSDTERPSRAINKNNDIIGNIINSLGTKKTSAQNPKEKRPTSSGRNQTEQVRGLFMTVHSELKRYAHALEPAQVHAKLHEKLIKVGIKNTPTLSSELFAVCETFKDRSDNKAIFAVLAAISRADVPNNLYEQPKNEINNKNDERNDYTSNRRLR